MNFAGVPQPTAEIRDPRVVCWLAICWTFISCFLSFFLFKICFYYFCCLYFLHSSYVHCLCTNLSPKSCMRVYIILFLLVLHIAVNIHIELFHLRMWIMHYFERGLKHQTWLPSFHRPSTIQYSNHTKRHYTIKN